MDPHSDVHVSVGELDLGDTPVDADGLEDLIVAELRRTGGALSTNEPLLRRTAAELARRARSHR